MTDSLQPRGCQASLSFTISWSLLKLMSIELVMPSNRLILCHSILLLPSIFPSLEVFSSESDICIMWPKYWSLSSSITVLPMTIHGWSPFGLTALISLLSKGLSTLISSTTIQKHRFFYAQPSLWTNSHIPFKITSLALATSCEELTHWKRLWCWEGLGAGEGVNRGWDGWMASLTRWSWVWVNSGSWWWTGRPGVLRFMESQRVGHDWETELNWTSWLLEKP